MEPVLSAPSLELHKRQRPLQAVLVDWVRPADQIAALADGQTLPCANINGQSIQLLDMRAGGIRSAYAAGTVIRCDQEVWVQAGCGHVVLQRLRDSQGHEWNAHSYFARQGIAAGHCFDLVASVATQAA